MPVSVRLSQIIFAVALIAKLRVGWVGATVLLTVFVTHLVFNSTEARYIYGVIFLLLTAGMLAIQREHLTAIRDRLVEFAGQVRARAGA